MNNVPSFKEDHILHIPAVHLLRRLCWPYVTLEQVLVMRDLTQELPVGTVRARVE